MNDSSLPAQGAAVSRPATPSRTRWFERRGWQFGSMEFHVAALTVHLFVGLFPLAAFIFTGFTVPEWPRAIPLLALLWALFVGFGYPVWAWFEARAFERWVRGLDVAQREAEQARFDARASLARHFWIAMLAIYLMVGVLGVAARA